MRKFSILLLVFALTLQNNLFSQKRVEFGLYVGSSITSMSGVDELADGMTKALTLLVGKDFPISASPRSFLINAGGFIEFNIKPWLALKGGVEYAPKGELLDGEVYLSTNLNMVSEVMEQSTLLRVGYIDFPISVQFSTMSKEKEGRVYCYVNLGISPATKIFSKMDIKTSLVERGFNKSGTTSKVLESDFQSQELEGIKSSDLGIFGSVGVGKNSFFLDFKFNRGINNILVNSDGENIKNSLYSLCVGFKF